MSLRALSCPSCDPSATASSSFTRRGFLRAAGAGAAAVGLGGASATLLAKPSADAKPPETLVKALYDSLKPEQKKIICFDWDYKERGHGTLRTHVSNNWRITPPDLRSPFYSKDQQAMIRQIWEGLVNPDWIERFDKQFKDDLGGFGKAQGIAIFGTPGGEKFEWVLTGRHGTVRCDGNTSDHVAFGGPIVYGHAASGYFEKHNHPGNVFWHQAEAANKIFKMLDGKQQKLALVATSPDEASVAFRAKDKIDGIPVSDLSKDQREHVQSVLKLLIEPYRQTDQDEVVASLNKQGGLDACRLCFYADEDMGNDGIYDNWRLEGPAFVWHYRGAPHVHVWVNVADDPVVSTNSLNRSGPLHEKEEKKK